MGFVQSLSATYEGLKASGRLLGSIAKNPLYTLQGYNTKAKPFMYPNSTITNGSTHQGQFTLSSTNVSKLILFHNKDLKKIARLLDYDFSVDMPSSGNGEVVFQLVGVPTITGTPTFTDISTSSIIEYDESPTVTLNNTIPLLQEIVAYNGSNPSKSIGNTLVSNLAELGLISQGNQYFAILAKDLGANGVTVRITLNWNEE